MTTENGGPENRPTDGGTTGNGTAGNGTAGNGTAGNEKTEDGKAGDAAPRAGIFTPTVKAAARSATPATPSQPRPAVSPRKTVLFILYAAALGFAAFLLLWRQPLPAGVEIIRHAVFHPDTPEVGPPENVTLPHRCRRADGEAGCAGVYRMTFNHNAESIEPLSIYIPTFSNRLILWVNGVMIADSRRLLSGAVVNQAAPMIALAPTALLRHGENKLEIRIDAWNATGGLIDPVSVGADRRVRPTYDVREFGLLTLPKLLAAWQAALCLSLFIVWVGRREEPVYLAMSAVLGIGTLQAAPLFVAGFDLSDWALRSANLANLWQTSLLPGIFARLFGRRSFAESRWMLAVPTFISVGFVALTLAPEIIQPWYGPIWFPVVAPWAVGCLFWSFYIAAVAAFRDRRLAAHFVVAALIVTVMVAVYDVVGVVRLEERHFGMNRFMSPLLMTVVSALLMWRFAMALREVSRFADVLQREKTALEAELRASFAREEERRRSAALESERLRLTRDLHDGLAGQLVSIVAQCELPTRDYQQVGLAARRALDDLRLVVSSLDDVGDDLALMLAQFHDRVGPQLRAQGIELDWRMTPLPDVKGLRSEHALALFRILQEAVTNAVRHSGTHKISIVMAPAGFAGAEEKTDYAVRIVVTDYGRGGVNERTGGKGMANMRRRAESLGASLTATSDETGSRIVVDLPGELPGAPPDASA